MTRIGGVSVESDVLVSADGVNLNSIWAEIQAALEIWNRERSSVASLLSYTTTNVADAIPQSLSSESMEPSSEFGVPHSTREPATALPLGYTFRDFDLALRYSRLFLRGATAEQIKAVFNRALEADNKLMNGSVLKRLFDPTVEQNEFGHNCFGLWSNDGIASPPPFMGKTFSANTTHYLPTGASAIDSADIEGLIALIRDKGYGRFPGSQLVCLANPYEAELISTFKAGVESRSGGPKAKWDFVRSKNAPPYLTNETIIGQIPPEKFEGLPVEGQYGPALLVSSLYVPQGYVAVVATSGLNSQNNPVAIRVHPNSQYVGFRIVEGHWKYPITESFVTRSFGVGVRHRGAAAVCQVTTDSTYTAPTFEL